jgi:shikimate kinase
MENKIFVLGLPGSGKSTAARYIESLARDYQLQPQRFNDYDVLYDMYQEDSGKKFSSTVHGGFDIHDHKLFDVALKRLECKVRNYLYSAGQNDLAIIEFSRNDYQKAFDLFTRDFLHNALFLFIDADEETCIERIQRRIDDPKFADDHHVSEYIFESYYFKDDRQYAAQFEAYNIDKGAATVIHNPAQQTLKDFCTEVEDWITPILQRQTVRS